MTEATTIRLTEKDREHIAAIVAGGLATNAAEAIRVALALTARRERLYKQIASRKQ